MSEPRRVVFDCNIFLQALASPDGPDGKCVELALAGQVKLFLSPVVIAEIQRVTSYPKLVARFKLRTSQVTTLLDNLPKAAIMIPKVPELWRYSRDPDDAHYINLALASNATVLVSRDRDLLDLMDRSKPEATAFADLYPLLRVLNPVAFLNEIRAI